MCGIRVHLILNMNAVRSRPPEGLILVHSLSTLRMIFSLARLIIRKKARTLLRIVPPPIFSSSL